MNDKIAVDIVLLPPEDIVDLAISLNKSLVSSNKTNLDRTNHFPHISLLMGSVMVARLKELQKLLQEIASDSASMFLTAHFESKGFSMLMIEPSNLLQELHEKIVESTTGLVTKSITEDSLFDRNVESNWIDYMNGFRDNSSFINFDPHITLGRGTNTAFRKAVSFKVDTVAIGRLGDRCTVRKILFKTHLAN